MNDILYTIPEVADILKCNENFVYKLIKNGLLPCLKLGRYKVRAQAVSDFLEHYENMDVSNPAEVKKLEFI